MIYRIKYRLNEPYKFREDIERELAFPVPGSQLRGAYVNAFLQYRCPYGHYWCKEDDCPDREKCFVPDELLGNNTEFSFMFFQCPKCDNDNNYTIHTPANWVICKKCLRNDTIEPTNYQELSFDKEIHQCIQCDSAATLQPLNAWVCNACSEISIDLVKTYDYIGVGINQKAQASEEGIIFDFPVLVSGYQFIQYINSDNEKFGRFLSDLVNKDIFIGGARSRGFGRLTIKKVEEIDLPETKSTKNLLSISPATIKDDKIGIIEKKKITFSNGEKAYYNDKVNSKEFEKAAWKSVISPGGIITLDEEMDMPGKQQLFGENADGFGGFTILPNGDNK